MCPTSTPRCRGPRVARAPRTALSKCGQSGRWDRRSLLVALSDDTTRAAETAARRSYSKLIAFLAARTRDVAGAEDALSEALAVALTEWPQRGVPDTPDA